MAAGSRKSQSQVDADGVRIERLGGVRGGVWWLAGALLFAAIALLLFARRGPAPSERGAAVADTPAAPGRPRVAARPVPPAAVAPRPAPPVPAAEPPAAPPDETADVPDHAEPVFGQATTAEPSGVALFPPLGSDPPKRGLVVPEDFPLPPGFVRHHQTTDDGEPLPPILMFHPDYRPLDADGEPLELPADRVVPEHMAPPGMPLRLLELPAEDGAPDAAP